MALQSGFNSLVAPASNTTAASGSKNSTNAVGLLTPGGFVDSPPYEITKCDQVIAMDKIATILDYDDYTTRKPAFATLSAYMFNLFETKNNSKLIESINLAHVKEIPDILVGSKDCILFVDSITYRNASICIKDEGILDNFKAAYDNLMKCRMGNDLKQFDPLTINTVLAKSCNGFSKTSGTSFDMPNIKTKMTEELRRAGFTVTNSAKGGAAGFGLKNTKKETTSTIPHVKIDLRVPGTPEPLPEKPIVKKPIVVSDLE